MGAVYEAIAEPEGERVALKIMRESSPAALYRLKREFRALSGMVHRNLVTLYDLHVDSSVAYFTMELVDGTGFLQYVRSPEVSLSDRLPRLRRAFAELVEGVSALHETGKLHRDLKPSNVLVTRDGRVVVLDFGLATPFIHDAPGQHVSDHALAGTLGYLAPELFSSNYELSPATDWYSVGIILFETLTEEAPPVGYSPELSVAKTLWRDASPSEKREVEQLVEVCASLVRARPVERYSGRQALTLLGEKAVSRSRVGAPAPRSQPAFVGRHAELAALRSAYEEVAERGRPVTLYIRGSSGTGKTTLARRFLQELCGGAHPPIVLTGRCYERESVPFQACDGLVDAMSRYLRSLPLHDCRALLPRRARDLAWTFPVLDRVDAIRNSPHSHRDHEGIPELERRHRSVGALKELLGRISEKSQLILWLDDLQWGDADSAALLSDVLSPPDAPALLFLGCYRVEDEKRSHMLSTLDPQLQAGASSSVARHTIEVGPLAEGDAIELARALLDEDADDSVLQRIAKEAQGHAYFLTALAHCVRHRNCDAADSPQSLADLVRGLLVSLPERNRLLVELVAVEGQPIERGALRSALDHLEGSTGATIHAAEQELVTARLLRTVSMGEHTGYEMFHDKVREIATAELDGVRLRRLHLALARGFQANHDVAADHIARHLYAADRCDEAFRYAVSAAGRASSEMAFQHAADLFELARRCRPHVPDAALLLGQAEALANAGRCSGAAPLYALAARHVPQERTFELERFAAEMYLISGLWKEGVAILRRLAEGAGLRFPQSHPVALAELFLERARLAARGLRFREQTSLSPDQLRKIDLCISLCKCMAMFEPIIAGYFLHRGLSLALDAGEPLRACHAYGIYLSVEAAFRETTRGDQEPRWTVVRELAYRSGDATLKATTEALEGVALLYLGQWKQAFELMDHADRALRRLPRGLPWDIGGRLTFIRVAVFFTGDLNHFHGLVSEHTHDTTQRGDLLEKASAQLHGAWNSLRTDELEQARETVAAAMRHFPMPAIGKSHEWPGVYLLAHIDLYSADFMRLRARLDEVWPALQRSGILQANVWGTLFLLFRAYASILTDGSNRHARQAKGLARRLLQSKHEWQSGFGHALDACIALQEGDPQRANRCLGMAHRAFERDGLHLYAACAVWQRGELAGDDEGARDAAAAEKFMRSQGIVCPRRWSAMYVPLPDSAALRIKN
jgi:serine/threonine protein kinase